MQPNDRVRRGSIQRAHGRQQLAGHLERAPLQASAHDRGAVQPSRSRALARNDSAVAGEVCSSQAILHVVIVALQGGVAAEPCCTQGRG